jgi:carboxypeptidase PM20D1
MHFKRLIALCAAGIGFAVPAAAQDQPHQRQARQILERLVSFRTAEGQHLVPTMVDYIVQTLRAGGVEEADIVRIPHGETMSLIVRVPGTETSEQSVGFAAHMDVVDARPEDWQRSPFTVIEENGTLFGRGVADNKTGVTSMLSTILRLHADHQRPRRTLLFLFSGDEETAGETAREIARHPWVAHARYIINTDAGGGQLAADGHAQVYLVQGAEKTYASYHFTASNPGGHSSRPRDDNAIYDLASALGRLSQYRFPVMSNAVTLRYFRAMGALIPGEEGAAMARFATDPTDAAAAETLRRNPEYVGMTRTTCVATRLDAGHADNALPERAMATVNCRIFPGTTIEAVRASLQQVAGTSVRVEVSDPSPESPVTDPIPEVFTAIERSVHRLHPNLPVTPYQEAGATDGLWFRTAGIPTLASSGMFSVPGSTFEHGLNERLPVASFYGAVEHIHDLAVELGQAGGGPRRR